ncbi:hypothetical protein M0D21_01400 [Aquimarina sp. D1M17]|uniref:hypothetical protein n=1 Tax=Aquimarina acroporae TaxID=2937283 RepID=UPI0020C12014|nr:hypothetical protein [Aquimarina acroporae]MCK8520199.1 hypothetical protein [Aquimarina acroporae]
MKSSTLLFRSIAILIVIAGVAHLVSFTSTNTDVPKGTTYKANNVPIDNSETDYIIGKWSVSHQSKEFTGNIIYEFKKEGQVFSAYIYEYVDENGNNQKGEGTKILTIDKFDGYKGTGKYTVTYQEQKYEIKCTIDMIDENSFTMSYDYYGYSDVETWKKL